MTEMSNIKQRPEGSEHLEFAVWDLFRASDFGFRIYEEKSEPGEIPGSLCGGLFHFMMV